MRLVYQVADHRLSLELPCRKDENTNMACAMMALFMFPAAAQSSAAPWTRASAADETKAAMLLQPLAAHIDDAKVDHERLRQQLIALRCTYPGTPTAQRAAVLLAKLPSPLDKLQLADRPPAWPEEIVHRIGAHARSIAALAFAPDGITLASSSWDGTLRLWKIQGSTFAAWAKLPGSASAIAFAPDGTFLASGRTDAQLALWDVTGQAPKECHTLPGHTHRPFVLAFTPNGKMLVTGCFGPTLRFWDLRAAEPDGWSLFSTDENAPGFTVASLAISGDGRLLATASHTGTSGLRLWTIDGALLDEWAVPKVKARLVAFSPDGKTLAVHGDGGTVQLWEAAGDKLRERIKLPGHPLPKQDGTVNAVVFTPDGKALATAGKDGKVVIWDTASGKALHRWTMPGEIKALALAVDGRHLAAGGSDGTIYLLRLPKAG